MESAKASQNVWPRMVSVVVHRAGNRAKAEETVKHIEAAGGKAIAIGADISKTAEVTQLFDKARTGFGIMVRNEAGEIVYQFPSN